MFTSYITSLVAFILSCNFVLGITPMTVYYFVDHYWRTLKRNRRTDVGRIPKHYPVGKVDFWLLTSSQENQLVARGISALPSTKEIECSQQAQTFASTVVLSTLPTKVRGGCIGLSFLMLILNLTNLFSLSFLVCSGYKMTCTSS